MLRQKERSVKIGRPGYDILGNACAAPVVPFHHRRWNGAGPRPSPLIPDLTVALRPTTSSSAFPHILRGPVRAILCAVVLLLAAGTAPSLTGDLLGHVARAQGTLTAESSRAEIERVVRNATGRPSLKGATWGISVRNLETGKTLFSHNPEINATPASNVKLYTAAAALETMGPDFRYVTRVYRGGPVENGVLKGPLVVRGSGDPSIGGEHTDDPTEVFRAWADSLRAAGIRQIDGAILGDDNIFDDEALGKGWSWDDTPFYYAAEISGLSFHRNVVDLTVRGQREGMPATLSWTPVQTDYVEFINNSVTTGYGTRTDEDYKRTPGTNVIHVGTTVPTNGTEREELTISNPTLYFAHVLREVLIDEGIAVTGAAMDVDDVPIPPSYDDGSLRRVASHTSPPLAELVAVLNTKSDNLYAEHIFRSLSLYGTLSPPQPTEPNTPSLASPPSSESSDSSSRVMRTAAMSSPPPSLPSQLTPGTANAAAFMVRTVAARAGADTNRVQFADGSGLSRHNLVSASATTDLLTYMYTHPNRDVRKAYLESLPLGGRDGTLEYRFRGNAPAARNVRAKTGTLSNVNALSGYVTSRQGTPLAFSILCINHTTRSSTIRRAQDAIVNALARL
jgi:serine-type D-Ala-D-Ala carboxypeptidase/endopeptidase (penicillin-binding protein 4)